jgi:AcrR family transcriptional regulator
MESVLSKSKVEVSASLYLKEPFSSDLGTLIVKEGSELIKSLGIENFTFKKLANIIGSTEPAIYRYFENKHKLLLYLMAWYWGWMEINLVYSTANLNNPTDRLALGIKLMVDGPIFTNNQYLNPLELHQLIINESLKGYLTKDVDDEHESGTFAQVYKFGDRISSIIYEINPNYKYPKALVSTVMEASLLQSFNAKHLPGMIETSMDSTARYQFFHQLVTNAITNEK